MTPGFAAKFGLISKPTNVGAQKIDGSTLETYGMSSEGFLLQDSFRRVRFFEETFWLANISIAVVLGMSFLFVSNVHFQFGAGELTWRSYTVAGALPTARRVEFINKHEFAKAALGENSETFVMRIAVLEAPKPTMLINHSRAPLLVLAGRAHD